MPGPVSDSYDPEFGTGANATDVREAIQQLVNRIGDWIGPELKNIVEIAHQKPGTGKKISIMLSERELRIIRFAMNRALESI